MAINPIELSYAKYVSPYAGYPIDILADASRSLQDRHWKNQEYLQQHQDLLGTMDVAMGDIADRNEYTSALEQSIRDLADKYEGTYHSPQFMREAQQTIRTQVKDPRIKAWQETLRGVESARAMQEKWGPQSSLDFNPYSSQHRTYDPTTGQANIYNPNTQQRLDWDKRKESMYDSMMADASTGRLSFTDIAGGFSGFMQYGSWQGISDKKVRGYLEEAYKRYIETPEGQQELLYLTSPHYEGLDRATAEDRIRKSLVATGRERVFGQSDTRYVADPFGKERIAAAQGGQDTGHNITPSYRVNPGVDYNQVDPAVHDRTYQTWMKGVQARDALNGTTSDTSQAAYMEAYKAASGNTQMTQPIWNLSPHQREQYANYFQLMDGVPAKRGLTGPGAQAATYIIGPNGRPDQVGDRRDVARGLGLTTGRLNLWDPVHDGLLNEVLGNMEPTGMMIIPYGPHKGLPGVGYVAQSSERMPQPHIIITPFHDQGVLDQFTDVQRMMEVRETGRPTRIPVGGGSSLYAERMLVNGNNGPEFTVAIRGLDAQGNPIDVLPGRKVIDLKTYTDWKMQRTFGSGGSGVMGTNIGLSPTPSKQH